MRRWMAGLLVVGSLAILTGCGGSSNSTLSYSAFSNAANTICKNVNTQSGTLGAGASATATPANASILAKVLEISDNGVAKIKKLSGPSALVTARDTFVTDATQTSSALKQAEAAAKAGNQPAYTAALKQLSTTNQQTNRDGSKLGSPACG